MPCAGCLAATPTVSSSSPLQPEHSSRTRALACSTFHTAGSVPFRCSGLMISSSKHVFCLSLFVRGRPVCASHTLHVTRTRFRSHARPLAEQSSCCMFNIPDIGCKFMEPFLGHLVSHLVLAPRPLVQQANLAKRARRRGNNWSSFSFPQPSRGTFPSWVPALQPRHTSISGRPRRTPTLRTPPQTKRQASRKFGAVEAQE